MSQQQYCRCSSWWRRLVARPRILSSCVAVVVCVVCQINVGRMLMVSPAEGPHRSLLVLSQRTWLLTTSWKCCQRRVCDHRRNHETSPGAMLGLVHQQPHCRPCTIRSSRRPLCLSPASLFDTSLPVLLCPLCIRAFHGAYPIYTEPC